MPYSGITSSQLRRRPASVRSAGTPYGIPIAPVERRWYAARSAEGSNASRQYRRDRERVRRRSCRRDEAIQFAGCEASHSVTGLQRGLHRS